MRMHIVAGANKLDEEKPGLRLGEPSTGPQHVHERTSLTKLEGHVDVIIVLKAVAKIHDVGMFQ